MNSFHVLKNFIQWHASNFQQTIIYKDYKKLNSFYRILNLFIGSLFIY